MKSKLITIVQIVVLIAVVFLLSTVLEPCTGEKTMKCNYSISVVKLLLVTVILIKGIVIFIDERIRNYFDAITILLLVDIILIPAWIIGGCKMADMACQARSFPGVYIGAAGFILWDVILIFRRIKKRKDTSQHD